MDHSETKYLPKIDHTPAKLEEWQRLLLKVADLIEKHGHTKGALYQNDGSLCFRGALNMAASGDPVCWTGWEKGGPAYLAELRMSNALGLKPHVMSSIEALSLPRWNNAPERTKGEVLAKMRAVALGG